MNTEDLAFLCNQRLSFLTRRMDDAKAIIEGSDTSMNEADQRIRLGQLDMTSFEDSQITDDSTMDITPADT